MAAKQLAQSLSHRNCEVPYVIGKDYNCLSDNSPIGLLFAEDSGTVYYNRDDVLIYHYETLNKLEVKSIPPIKKTHGIYASSLRSSLPVNMKFNKGDILYEYDCFKNGIPSIGYNAFSAMMPCFGFNHEDSILISESFAEKTRANFVDKVYVPIYEYTLLQQLYDPSTNHFGFFPNIGEEIKNSLICCTLTPKITDNMKYGAHANMKNKMMLLLKSMNLSDLLSIQNSLPNMNVEKIKSKLEHGKVSGIKIHKLMDNVKLLDKRLQTVLDGLYKLYTNVFIDAYHELETKFMQDVAKDVLRRHYVYKDKDSVRGKLDLKNVAYVLEIEVTDECQSHVGDKFANRYANKGVVSLVFPDDIAPIAVQSNKPVDIIFNPFGVFSRMNLGQLVEGIVSKNVMHCDSYIKEGNKKDLKASIWWLNEYIIKNLNDMEYYNRVNSEVIARLDEPKFKEQFIEDVKQHNLFIEAPTFGEINVRNILKNGVNPNEQVYIKKEFLQYMKDKLKCNINMPIQDVVLPNIYCAPMYIEKLYKLANKLITARDLGPIKSITGQPKRGRANEGGSRLGQMELEGILAHGCERTLKEFLTVKSDQLDAKRDLIMQLMKTGNYRMRDEYGASGRTKKVVDTLLHFLRE
jgi:DNA-directed RNA polymerase beta subunit